MKLKMYSIVALCVAVICFSSCGENNSKGGQEIVTDTTEATKNTEVTDIVETKGETATGKLTLINESGIPGLFVLSVEVNGEEQGFNFVGDGNALNSLLNKDVVVNYVNEEALNVLDIVAEKTSIIGEWGAIHVNGGLPLKAWKTVDGVLSATELSGDLPSKFSVKRSDGSQVEFTDFVKQGHLDANGKEVTVYYSTFVRKVASGVVAK